MTKRAAILAASILAVLGLGVAGTHSGGAEDTPGWCDKSGQTFACTDSRSPLP